eukprot:gene13633-18294_t
MQKVAFVTYLAVATAGWIDPDTFHGDKSIKSNFDNRDYQLVFSDEFNTPNRYFHDGEDPRWTAINKNDYTNFALHYYNGDLVSTNNGYLNITTVAKDISFVAVDKQGLNPEKITKNYQSGMIQGWNKFCFTGGIIEVSAKLPGKHNIGGFWPAIWLLGNLARATYVGSSNNVWPWSYDTCNKDLQKQQEFSACNVVNHFDLHPKQGRGAPEIDILEAMPGDEILFNTPIKKPYYSASLQIAPGSQDYRPTTGETPAPGLWYENDISYGNDTSLNIFFYGMHLEGITKDQSYIADALSANKNIGYKEFNSFNTYRVEWIPGKNGYIRWYQNDNFVYGIEANALNLTGGIIPEEPMYIILNNAISSTWGFPTPCPEGCPCDCFDCTKDECQCAVPAEMRSNLPASMLIDWVRVYQAVGDDDQIVGCSTSSHPTKRYIKGHESLYKSDKDQQALKDQLYGGGHCVIDEDCGSLLKIKSGECIRNKCKCLSDVYTGSHCL